MPEKIYKPSSFKENKEKFLVKTPVFRGKKKQKSTFSSSQDVANKNQAGNKDNFTELDNKVEEDVNDEFVYQEKIKELENEKIKIQSEYKETIKKAEEESEKIIEFAEIGAFKRIKNANEEFKRIIDIANEESENVLNASKVKSDDILKETEDKKEEIIKKAYKEGFDKGHQDSFDSYKPILEKTLAKLEQIISQAINKRNEIIESSEKQLSDISITIAKKIIKSISESDQSIIIRNVTESIRKIKGKTRITIRVNINDLELITHHKDEFYQMLNNIEQVNILEDPNIERGGCVIETDFGEIDARISSQFNKIESAIKRAQPITEL